MFLRSWQSLSKEIPHLSRNLTVHYCVHKSLLPDLTQSQINPVHIFPPHLLKIHSDIILPSIPTSSKWFLPFRISNQDFLCISDHPQSLCATYPVHLTVLDFINLKDLVKNTNYGVPHDAVFSLQFIWCKSWWVHHKSRNACCHIRHLWPAGRQ